MKPYTGCTARRGHASCYRQATVGSLAIFPRHKFRPVSHRWPTPYGRKKKRVQNHYSMKRETFQWFSQNSCIFPAPSAVLETHYFTPRRLSLLKNHTVLHPIGVSHDTKSVIMRDTGDPHWSQSAKCMVAQQRRQTARTEEENVRTRRTIRYTRTSGF
jgi:hypothetical protein